MMNSFTSFVRASMTFTFLATTFLATMGTSALLAAPPHVVLIVADDKYVYCLASSEKRLQIRTFFRFPGFRQATADCDELTGIAVD